jgi:hypothetical protein
MGEPALTVKIGADTADLATKLAIANANLKNFNAEVRGQAAAYTAAGDAERSQMLPGLQSAAAAAQAAKVEVAGLNAEMRGTAVAAAESGAGLSAMVSRLESGVAPVAELKENFAKLGELFLATFAVEKVAEVVEKFAELGSQLEVMSQKTGMSVQAIQAWHYAATQAGVDTASFDSAAVKLGRSMEQALRQPTSMAAEAFHALGISQDELRAHSNDLDYMLRRMADGFHSHADGANADAVAQATLGRAGAELIPVLREGASAVDDATKKLNDMGAMIDGPTAEALHRHRQAVNDIGLAWQNLLIQLTPWIETATRIIQWLTTNVQALENAVNQATRILDPFGQQASNVAGKSLTDLETQLTRINKAIETTDAEMAKSANKAYYQHQLDDLNKQAVETADAIAKLTATEKQNQTANVETGAPKPELPQIGMMASPAAHAAAQSALEDFRLTLQQLEAAWDGTHADLLARELAMWDEEIAGAKLSAREKIQAEMEVARIRKELAKGEEDALDKFLDGQAAGYENLTRTIEAEDKKQLADFIRTTQQEIQHEQSKDSQIAGFLSSSVMSMLTSRGNFMVEVGRIGDRMMGRALDWIFREALAYVEGEQTKTAALVEATAAQQGVKTSAAATSEAVDAATSSASIFKDAAKAAAGAYSAVAGLPIVGPVLAPAAAAAAYAAVMAFDVFGAAGGFDVPSGMEPLVQLHEREMVLPASLADPLRDLLGATSGVSPAVAAIGNNSAQHVTINAPLTVHHSGGETALYDYLNRLNRTQARRLARKVTHVMTTYRPEMARLT